MARKPKEENTATQEQLTEAAAASTEVKETKSIVPAKYAGKYKGGGQGATSDFIRATCGEGDKFEYPAFFSLCRKNGIAEDKVALYEGQVESKTQGANGRARMTLGNMLRALARKNQKLVNLADEEVEVAEPAAKLTGAAAAAAAKADEVSQAPAEQDEETQSE